MSSKIYKDEMLAEFNSDYRNEKNQFIRAGMDTIHLHFMSFDNCWDDLKYVKMLNIERAKLIDDIECCLDDNQREIRQLIDNRIDYIQGMVDAAAIVQAYTIE